MKLSQVKSEADWEEYAWRKEMTSWEKLRIESGIGPDAWGLPAPPDHYFYTAGLDEYALEAWGDDCFEDD